MPIYEYDCLKCGLSFDYLLRTAQDTAACPRCKQGQLKRRVSVFAFNAKDSSGNITSSSAGCSSCSGQDCSSCS